MNHDTTLHDQVNKTFGFSDTALNIALGKLSADDLQSIINLIKKINNVD